MPLVSAQMTGVNAVTAALHAKSPSGRAQATAEVGYSAPYAIYVHENLAANHPNGGQAKFLEQPLRTEVPAMQATIQSAIKNKNGMVTAVTQAANILKRASQKLCPVDTGFLVNSAFIVIK